MQSRMVHCVCDIVTLLLFSWLSGSSCTCLVLVCRLAHARTPLFTVYTPCINRQPRPYLLSVPNVIVIFLFITQMMRTGYFAIQLTKVLCGRDSCDYCVIVRPIFDFESALGPSSSFCSRSYLLVMKAVFLYSLRFSLLFCGICEFLSATLW